MGKKVFPRRRRNRPPPDPFDQPDAEAPFELAHLQAHRRLAEAQPLGGGREAAEFDDLRKRLHLVQVQSAHIKVYLMQRITSPIFTYVGARGNVTARGGTEDCVTCRRFATRSPPMWLA